MRITHFRTSAAAVALVIAAPVGVAQAQDLSASISCLKGRVAGTDYAELGQKLRESIWDSKGGVSLVSDISNLKLRVVDVNGSSVCQETANNTTSCTFKVNLTSLSEFTIFVDNADNSAESHYSLCAF